MKIFTTTIIAALLAVSYVSCKKDHDEKTTSIPLSTIQGKWEGSYVNEASGNTFFYSFNFKPGGVIEEIDDSGEKIGEGTWTFENNILLAHYNWLPPYTSSYSVIASYYSSTGKLLGNWGYGESTTDGGTWQMIKK